LNFLKTELHNRLEGLTTYDEYISELESGHLVWSPTHESENFWKENGMRVGQEENGKAIKWALIPSLPPCLASLSTLRPREGSESGTDRVRLLVDLLKTSKSPLVLSIAAHDIGQFIKYGGDKAKQ
jgi:V-type H+-transporting ATPase subunit H